MNPTSDQPQTIAKPTPTKPRQCCVQFNSGRWGDAYADIAMAKHHSVWPLLPMVELTPEVLAVLLKEGLL